jgi:hypothetical protein
VQVSSRTPVGRPAGAIAWLAALTGHHPEALDRAAAAAGPGADGVRFVPALGGAMVPRWDPVARGAFVGLGPGHGPGHLARAIYEACATAMDTVGGHLRDRGLTWHTIALVGGGAAAETWAQVRADLAGRPVARYAEVDAAPRGAAMLALAVAEACALADVIARGATADRLARSGARAGRDLPRHRRRGPGGDGGDRPPRPRPLTCVEVDLTCAPLYAPTWANVSGTTLGPKCAASGCHTTAAAKGGLILDDPATAYERLINRLRRRRATSRAAS